MVLKAKTDLSEKISCCDISLTPADNKRLMSLCGKFDEHIRQIENRLNIEIKNRGADFQIFGNKHDVHIAHTLLNHLYALTENGYELSPQQVHLALQEVTKALEAPDNSEHATLIRTSKKTIKTNGKNQQKYVQNIREHDLTIGIGPAGTGKTYLAVAMAVEALEAETVKRILLVRPAVEAGERLGFLPGDLSQKIDPYLRPLIDALYEMLGFERVSKLVERNMIELAPLAYMRGRTLNDAFIILDEGQNTTIEQMKMFLTRLGFGSKAVITGDVTQIDLPRGVPSGLKQIMHILKDVPGIEFNFFESRDVVRHPLVQKIVEAYEKEQGSDERS